MVTETLTLTLPSDVYVRIKKRAEEANRTVEAEAVESLAAIFPAESDPAAGLELLDNVAVERAARGHLALELLSELQSLNHKQQREGLTETERARQAELAAAYERAILIRAHAAAILKRRGVDVAHLIARP